MKSTLRFFTLTIAATLFLTMLAGSAIAQSGLTTIRGTVTDAQGAVVAGANVKLVNEAKNFVRTSVTSENGTYSFTSVPPDTYRVEVEATGFKKSLVSNVTGLVDKATDANVSLETGAITEVVNVSGEDLTSIVNTQDASLGNNFVAKQIAQLPLEGRNVVNLLSLQPGVTPDGAVVGGRQDQANITLDGIDVNDQQTGLNIDQTEAFASVLRVTPDSISEFRVTTSNPDASKGRSAGAQVALLTKSGSNRFSGSLFEYHRNTLTTANDWFNNVGGTPRPKLIRNLFGGSLGGPIVKDRVFFFYSYEGMREAKDVGVTQIVPLPSLGQGIIQFFDNNGVLRSLNTAQINSLTVTGGATAGNVVDVNPISLGILAAAAARYPANLPLGSAGSDGLNTGAFRFNAPLPVNQNTNTAKIDWNITNDQRHTFSFRANAQYDLFGRASAFPDTPPADRWSHPIGGVASYTWLPTNNLTNRFSYGLTRLAYSNQGDSGENAITFRDIYTPLNFTRTFSRVNPTHNIVNDLTWIKGNHTWQFGTNIRMIRNKRTNLASAFDNGTTNFGFYPGSGSSVTLPINQYLAANFGTGTSVSSAWIRSAQSSLVALLGRVNQYTANFIFDIDGNPVNGEPTIREWATEEYDWYAQDSWKVRPNVTLTLGLRYGLSRPVYETQGFQAAPTIALDEYFRRRVEASFNGQNYTDPIVVEKIGPANGKPGFYEWDKNNFQPRVAVSWSPNFTSGFLGKVFGSNNTSVIRGGAAITNDYFGQQLAVQFDAANTLGFVSRYTTPANLYNLTTNPAPALTGLGMNIRNLPNVVIPGNLTFPLQQSQNFSRRIESSIDRGVQAPVNYSFNLTYGRQLPGQIYVETSYVARLARNLLATRDVMTPNNLRDPQSGEDFYGAATAIEIFRRANLDAQGNPNLNAAVPQNPYWANLWGAGLVNTLAGLGCASPGVNVTQAIYQTSINCVGDNDWSDMQNLLDNFSGRRLFYQSQYGALDSFGTIAKSNYHGGTLSVRQRLSSLTWDFNYTFAKSLDDTSGLQTAGAFGGAFILNPLRQSDNYGPSDFDMRHIINFNSVWQLPFGKGRTFLSGAGRFLDALVGGWQFSSIVRFNSGEPIGTVNKYFDNAGWVTNWNLKSAVVQTQPIDTGVFINNGGIPNMFADPAAAYRSFRSPYPGETGDRNRIRFPAYYVADIGLAKSFAMPWENHRLGFRWEVFNVTNTPIFTGIATRSLGYNPSAFSGTTAPAGFGEFTQTKGDARVMQFALRYDF
jgi:Carboxypeptidase regulatory-like domain